MNQRLKPRVEAFMGRLASQDVCMHGFILSVGGQLKATAEYAPFREGEPHRMYSVSKSMTALAVGLLLDEGKCGLDDYIADHFPDCLPARPDRRLLRLTIRDMLPMTTCHRATAYREGIDADWTRPFFAVKPNHEPGTVFHYDTGCSQTLAALVKRLSGQSVMAFLSKRLFDPIGASDRKYWLTDPSGACTGGTGLCMSLRDLHKTALLVMQGGQGVLPGWFCREMTRRHVGTDMQTNPEERYGYGWQCWRTRAGYAFYGMGGQLAVCCPDRDALLCTVADTRLDPFGVQKIYDAFFELVYPFLGQEDMQPTRYEKQVQALPHQPGCQLRHKGAYRFEPNVLGLVSLELQEQSLMIENARGRHGLRFGLGENITDVFPGWPGVPSLSSGGWQPGGRLRVRCYAVGDAPCGVDLLLCFKENSVTVQARRSPDPVTDGYEGTASGYLT